jgi:hypothetical protein
MYRLFAPDTPCPNILGCWDCDPFGLDRVVFKMASTNLTREQLLHLSLDEDLLFIRDSRIFFRPSKVATKAW